MINMRPSIKRTSKNGRVQRIAQDWVSTRASVAALSDDSIRACDETECLFGEVAKLIAVNFAFKSFSSLWNFH